LSSCGERSPPLGGQPPIPGGTREGARDPARRVPVGPVSIVDPHRGKKYKWKRSGDGSGSNIPLWREGGASWPVEHHAILHQLGIRSLEETGALGLGLWRGSPIDTMATAQPNRGEQHRRAGDSSEIRKSPGALGEFRELCESYLRAPGTHAVPPGVGGDPSASRTKGASASPCGGPATPAAGAGCPSPLSLCPSAPDPGAAGHPHRCGPPKSKPLPQYQKRLCVAG